jgi:copper chaperone CopZ
MVSWRCAMHQYEFAVRDVTCEKCDARIREAVEGLPGAVQVELVRTPENEALVSFESDQEIAPTLIERAIEARSAGTEHDYRVRWATT